MVPHHEPQQNTLRKYVTPSALDVKAPEILSQTVPRASQEPAW